LRKTKLYLDTSVISFYYAEDALEKMAVTRKFFDQELAKEEYEVYISDLTIRELSNCTNPEQQEKLVKFAYGLTPNVLTATDEIDQIAVQFVEDGVIPAKYQEDALHLAFALHHNLDYVLSWNFKHLVTLKTKRAVKVVAAREGFKEIEILTPEEVVTDED
jgi:predicted nucleic acid-binding protein